MKVRTYVRIAKGPRGPKVTSSNKWTDEPIKDSQGSALPTVAFAVDFVIDDAAFKQPTRLVATLDIKQPQPLVQVTEVED